MEGFKKYELEMGCGVLSFRKIGSGIQKLLG
jgi:hypothetical protein